MLSSNRRVAARGFTLVELLVVIAIIGVLVALLLPAVQAAREAARRAQCSNNFKQVGVALHNHHAALKHFPAGINMWRSTDGACSVPPSQPSQFLGWGWGTFLLPYLESGAIYDQIDFSEGIYAGPKSFVAGGKFVETYLCPSDPQGDELVFCCTGSRNGATEEEDLARTNMAGVADSRDWSCNGSWPRLDADGALFQFRELSTKDMTDGTSNTLMVGEIVGFGEGSHTGLFWVTWDILHTANGINLPVRLTPSGPWVVEETGFASFHPGGCHFLMADSSVHFINQEIDQAVLAALTTRQGGEPVDGEF